MIPSSTCSASDPTENVPTNSLAIQWGDKEERQVIVNNYYIRDKAEGWKQVKQSKISQTKYFKNPYADQIERNLAK